MLLEAVGWRCLLKNSRFPLRFDAFGGFWMEISLKICGFPLGLDAFEGLWIQMSIEILKMSIEI